MLNSVLNSVVIANCLLNPCLFKQKEEERLRTQLRRESQQRRIRERGHNKGLSASYLEPDRYGEEEDDFQSLLALKKKYKKDLAQGEFNKTAKDYNTILYNTI